VVLGALGTWATDVVGVGAGAGASLSGIGVAEAGGGVGTALKGDTVRRGRRGFGSYGGASVVARYCTTAPPPSASPSIRIRPKRSHGASVPPRAAGAVAIASGAAAIGVASFAASFAVGVVALAAPATVGVAATGVPVALVCGTPTVACAKAQPASTSPATIVRRRPRIIRPPPFPVSVHRAAARARRLTLLFAFG